MKITKAQLKEMIRQEAKRQTAKVSLNEGFAVDEGEYFKLKARMEKDFAQILSLAEDAELAAIDDEALDAIMQIIEIAGRHVR